MISLNGVTDSPQFFGSRLPLLSNLNLEIPRGRYAVLSRTPEVHRALIDVLAGLRPPCAGFVQHRGLVSWPLGRQGFIRGKASGLRMIEFVCTLYGVEPAPSIELVADLLTSPEHLKIPMEHWPPHTRYEFSFALALAPAFDVYVIEGAIPFEPRRFTRLWLALFEARLVGRTLILSTYRQNQMADHCIKGLIYERSVLRIDDDLDECILRYPSRRSRIESAEAGEDIAVDALSGGQFNV